MTPSLYDLLDVDPSASPEEIRTAWRAAIADLDPSARRFRMFNQAAEVLLDPDRRAAYDVEHAELEDEPAPVVEDDGPAAPVSEEHEPTASVSEEDDPPAPVVEEGALAPVAKPAELDDEPEPEAEADPDPETDDEESTPRRGRDVPSWLLIGLAAALVLVVALTAFAWTRPGATADAAGDTASSGAADAEKAALAAAEPVLSYNYRSLEDDVARAEPYLTSDYAEKYGELIGALRTDVERTQTVVDAQVVASAITREDDDLVDVLVFVDQATTKKGEEPFTLRMWVTMRMERVDGQWLVDTMNTGSVLPDQGSR